MLQYFPPMFSPNLLILLLAASGFSICPCPASTKASPPLKPKIHNCTFLGENINDFDDKKMLIRFFKH